MSNKTIEASIIDKTITTVESNATSVRPYAFYYAKSLVSVSLPNALTIGETAFQGCSNLASFYAPIVETVGGGAFILTALTELHIESAKYVRQTIATPTTKIFLGKGLLEISGLGGGSVTCIYDFEHSNSDPVLFSMANWPIQGQGSKISCTYTIYTDNETIKNGCLARANNYTTINVYHRDGSSW